MFWIFERKTGGNLEYGMWPVFKVNNGLFIWLCEDFYLLDR